VCRWLTTLELLRAAYRAFNTLEVEMVLSRMHPPGRGPTVWRAGYVYGRAGVRAYWMREWWLVDPAVAPLAVVVEPDGRIRVDVHQHVVVNRPRLTQ
jgi:hypothetical protein